MASHSPIPQIGEGNCSAASLLQAPVGHPDNELLDTSLGDCLAGEIRAHTDSQSVTHPRLASGTPSVTDGTAASNSSQLFPYIEFIAPSSGSTLGGTWVYVIGTNFRPDHQILFGGVLGKTVYWSETALRCQAPPSEKPVSVAISISGIPLEAGGAPGDTRFTYEDSTEYESYVGHIGAYIASSNNDDLLFVRNIAALRCIGQALGIKDQLNPATHTMTGGPPGEQFGGGIHHARFPGSAAVLEQCVIGALKLADREPAQDPSTIGTSRLPTSDAGRSLLHLAASLGFDNLIRELIKRGADLDKRDASGYTALHYSILYGRNLCTQVLVQAGAYNDASSHAAQAVHYNNMDAKEVRKDAILMLSQSQHSSRNATVPGPEIRTPPIMSIPSHLHSEPPPTPTCGVKPSCRFDIRYSASPRDNWCLRIDAPEVGDAAPQVPRGAMLVNSSSAPRCA